MLALFIQSIYNIVDSYFVSQYSAEGLTALSIIYPIQLLMTALTTGTGAGLNILIFRMDGEGKTDIQHHIVKNGILTGIFNSLIFVIFGTLFIGIYYHISSNSDLVRTEDMQRLFPCFLLVCSLRQIVPKSSKQREICFYRCMHKLQVPLQT